MSHVEGKLTQETYIALTHTLTALVELCRYIFCKYGFSYILTAKLQTDSLEGRFGAYRRLSGCTYNVSVEQILESERKLKVLGLLKLKSAKLGEFSLSDFSSAVNKVSKEENSTEGLENLESALEEMKNVVIPLEAHSVLICIASYTSMQVTDKIRKTGNNYCSECLEMLQSEEQMPQLCETELNYFSQLNRGGLKRPSPMMVFLCSEMYKLFQTLISNAYEQDFLKLGNHHDAVVTLGIQMSECIISNWEDVCKCGVPMKKLVKKCIKVLGNIFINNYTKLMDEKSAARDIARKLSSQKRKRKSTNVDELKLHKRKELKLSSK